MMLKTQQAVRFDWGASTAAASHVLLAYSPVRFVFKCLLASSFHASWPYMLAHIYIYILFYTTHGVMQLLQRSDPVLAA